MLTIWQQIAAVFPIAQECYDWIEEYDKSHPGFYDFMWWCSDKKLYNYGVALQIYNSTQNKNLKVSDIVPF